MSGERKIVLGLVAALLIMAAGMYGWKVAAVTRWRTDWLRGKRNRPKRMASSSLPHSSQNHLLAALSAVEPDPLISHLDADPYAVGEALHEAGNRLPYAYFPTSAIISLRYILENDENYSLPPGMRGGTGWLTCPPRGIDSHFHLSVDQEDGAVISII